MEECFTGVMDVVTIFPLLWEMRLFPFLAVIKEVAVGGATSGILYNELSKEIMTV